MLKNLWLVTGLFIAFILTAIASCEFGRNDQVSWCYPPRVGNHNFTIFVNRYGVEIVHTDRNKQYHATSIFPDRFYVGSK